jgi:hypothetical protein
MDAQYLKKTVGPALAKGLAAASVTRPQDPIEYLANWLIKYVENQERDNQVESLEVFGVLIDDEAATRCVASRGAKATTFRELRTPAITFGRG